MKKGFTSCVAGSLAAMSIMSGAAFGHETDAPQTKGAVVIPELEKRAYISNMEVLAHVFPGEKQGGKMQMMAMGEKRFLVQSVFGRSNGIIIDVSDALRPVVVNNKAWIGGGNFQVAFNKDLQKWIMMVSHQIHNQKDSGLRGVEFWDISDPVNTKLLSRWSVDGGDPSRANQGGSGPHRSFYDGGRYAYLSTAPNNDFFLDERKPNYLGYQWGLQVLDVSDPAAPKLVSNWHMPGQHKDESGKRSVPSVYADNPVGLTSLHGAVYVPKPVEKGGQFGFGPWGEFGMVINDLSNPAQPRMVSQWRPESKIVAEGMAAHTVDVTRLDRGFVLVSPEEFLPGCDTPRRDIYAVDVSDPANPKQISKLPLPVPPAEAPYKSFCERFGRFGAHNAPHLKAPGKPAANFTCYSYFNAGLQCFDISDIRQPRISAFFIPEQGGPSTKRGKGVFAEGARTVDNVFIEWDRNLVWVAADNGLYLLATKELGEPVLTPKPVVEWAVAGLNQGHP